MTDRTQLLKSSCGHALPRIPRPGPTGYARTNAGEILCYSCADRRVWDEACDLRAGDEPMVLYVGQNGQDANRWTLTTWTGDVVGHVKQRGEGWISPSTRGWFIVAKIIGGPWVYGRALGPGMYVKVRAYKDQPHEVSKAS